MDLTGLNPAQQEAARTIDGPLLVLAGAGTGKTTVVTRRIAYMLSRGIAPENVLAVTFTNKAAREMKERLQRLLPNLEKDELTVATFHSFCCRLLRQHIGLLGEYDTRFGIADDGDREACVRESVQQLGYHGRHDLDLAFFKNGIADAKNKLHGPDDVREYGRHDMFGALADVYYRYQRNMRNMNLVDFDDLLLLTVRLWRTNTDLLKQYRERYQYVLVDEYQDTNAVQAELMRLLARPKNNICVVGDDDQSIYAWRGADVANILDFPTAFPGAKVVKLEENYRSTSHILEAANFVIANNQKRHGKILRAAAGEGEKIKVVETASDTEEARLAVRFAKQIQSKDAYSWRDVALLFRSNHQTRAVEDALRKAGVPYRIIGGKSFYERREIRDAVAYLRVLNNPRDDLSLLRILNVPTRGIGDKTIDRLKEYRRTTNSNYVDVLRDVLPSPAIADGAKAGIRKFLEAWDGARAATQIPGDLAHKLHQYLERIDYLPGLGRIYKNREEALERHANVVELLDAAAGFEAQQGPSVTLLDFLEAFSLTDDHDRAEADDDGVEDAVTLMTVHSAKGLEFPAVMVAGLEQKLFPHERSLLDGQVDEERRLFYVAVTRAKEHLLLSRAKNRMKFGGRQSARPSQFLGELPAGSVEHHDASSVFTPPSRDDVADMLAQMRAAWAQGSGGA